MEGERKQFVVAKKEDIIEEIKNLPDEIEHVSLNLIKCDFNATEKDIEKTFPEFHFLKVKNYNPGSFEVIFETRIDAINFIRTTANKKVLSRTFFIKMGRQQKEHAENWSAVGYVPRQFKQPHKKPTRDPKKEEDSHKEEPQLDHNTPVEQKSAESKPVEEHKTAEQKVQHKSHLAQHKTIPQKAPEHKTEQKAAEPKPAEKPLEHKAPEHKVQPKPIQHKPAEHKPAQHKPIEHKVIENKPDKPAEHKKAESKPVEHKPVEHKPAEHKAHEGKTAEHKAGHKAEHKVEHKAADPAELKEEDDGWIVVPAKKGKNSKKK